MALQCEVIWIKITLNRLFIISYNCFNNHIFLDDIACTLKYSFLQKVTVILLLQHLET